MSDLSWYNAIPPRDLTAEGLIAALRTLATRPRIGFFGRTPTVVFELWGQAGEVRWLLGVEERAGNELTQQLKAHLPRLSLVHEPMPQRPTPLVATDLRHHGFTHPLRADMAEEVAKALHEVLRGLQSGESAVVQWLVGPTKGRARAPQPFRPLEILGLRERRIPDAAERRDWRVKAEEALFECVGRLGATASHDKRARAILRRLAGGIALANSSQATLYPRRPRPEMATALSDVAAPFFWSSLLSAAELAAVLGWPVQEEPTHDLPMVGGHINLAPQRLLVDPSEVDTASLRVLGESLHPAQRGQLAQMPASSGPYHLHLIGPTGSGKSTLLAHLILADVTAGRGVLVVEPRGDLVEDLLNRIPVERHKDVVIIDPADAATYGSVGLNVLAGPLETAERRADELVALLAAMAGSNWGPRTADVALHAILTVSKLDDGVLPDVVAVLTNPAFRRSVIGKVSDPLVLGPWWAAFDALSDGERGQHIAPLLNKLRPLLSRNALRHMLGQSKPHFSFDDLFTKKRIVLVNLNAGMLGGPAADLLGALVLSQVWSSLQRRAAIPREQRAMTGLYVDEFQGYTSLVGGVDFGDLLTQSRALGGAWTLAHQHFAQLNSSLEAAVIANARSRITFRPGVGDAKALAASFASTMTAADLLRLGSYEAVAQIHLDGRPTEPFAVRTRPLGQHISNGDELRRASADRYATDGASVDSALASRWHGPDPSTQGPIGTKQRSRS